MHTAYNSRHLFNRAAARRSRFLPLRWRDAFEETRPIISHARRVRFHATTMPLTRLLDAMPGAARSPRALSDAADDARRWPGRAGPQPRRMLEAQAYYYARMPPLIAAGWPPPYIGIEFQASKKTRAVGTLEAPALPRQDATDK